MEAWSSSTDVRSAKRRTATAIQSAAMRLSSLPGFHTTGRTRSLLKCAVNVEVNMDTIDEKKLAQKEYDQRTNAKNGLNEYVRAIPEPHYKWLGCECDCGRFFRNYENYRGHYALKHILYL